MACCEYTCFHCHHDWFDNIAKNCPKCGSTRIKVIGFDEIPEREIEDEGEE